MLLEIHSTLPPPKMQPPLLLQLPQRILPVNAQRRELLPSQVPPMQLIGRTQGLRGQFDQAGVVETKDLGPEQVHGKFGGQIPVLLHPRLQADQFCLGA